MEIAWAEETRMMATRLGKVRGCTLYSWFLDVHVGGDIILYSKASAEVCV